MILSQMVKQAGSVSTRGFIPRLLDRIISAGIKITTRTFLLVNTRCEKLEMNITTMYKTNGLNASRFIASKILFNRNDAAPEASSASPAA